MSLFNVRRVDQATEATLRILEEHPDKFLSLRDVVPFQELQEFSRVLWNRRVPAGQVVATEPADIKRLALLAGFTEREQPNGTRDLNPYVYAFGLACHRAGQDQTDGRVEELEAEIERLRTALTEVRNWFESERKSISKGNGSQWSIWQCQEQMETIDEAMGQPHNGMEFERPARVRSNEG